MTKDEPIIQSLLDTDFYKFTMGQFVFSRYPAVPVRYAFVNRTKDVKLANLIDKARLKEELDHARTLTLSGEELAYLSALPEIKHPQYFNFLASFRLPEYELDVVDGNFKIEFFGPWRRTIYWETIALAIANELYGRTVDPSERTGLSFGRNILQSKINVLRDYPRIKIADFGTRRRYLREWHDEIIAILKEELAGQFLGTSNVYLAKKHGVALIGTMGHQLFQVMSGIMHESDEEIRASHNKVLREWWDEYGYDLSIALTDTYGSDFFFYDMTIEQAEDWKGLRQDSGDPIEFGYKAIRFYKDRYIDPRKKLIVFSDGLKMSTILNIDHHFRDLLNFSFGWGTNLTNDVGIKPLSLVVKAVEANGHGLVKLSDNMAKAIGKPEDIERFKRIFDYSSTMYKECEY